MPSERDDEQRRQALAAAVEQARLDLRLSKLAAWRKAESDPTTRVGKTIWYQVFSGSGPIPSDTTIVRMAKALEVDPAVLLAAARHDLVQTNPDGTLTIFEIKTGNYDKALESTVTPRASDISEQLRGIRTAVERLAEAYRQLAERLPAPSHQPTPPGSRARRTALRAAPQDLDSRP